MAHALLKIVHDSPVPIYRQIVDQVRMHIASGALAPGDALPSVRSLATQLGVHFNTAAEAYRELAQEGFITLAHGKRATVQTPSINPPVMKAEADSLRQRLRHLIAEMRLKGIPGSVIREEVDAVVGS